MADGAVTTSASRGLLDVNEGLLLRHVAHGATAKGPRMSFQHKLMFSAMLALALMLGVASGASASRVGIEPGGSIRLTSIGNFVFTSGSGSIECPMTMSGTLAASAEGTLSARPDPSRNPKIGDITGGSIGRCNTGSAVVLAFPWAIYEYGAEGARARLYVQKLNYLQEMFIVTRCLVEAQMLITYTEEAESKVRFTAIEQVVARALSGGICPERPGYVGEFRLAPRQRLTLT